MRKLALDIGLARIGVASSHGTLVLPHSALTNDSKSVEAVANLYAEISANCCYVGLPLSLSGGHTKSTSMAIDFAAKLARATRPASDEAPEFVKEMVGWGAGPRAGISLISGAKAHAVLRGRVHATTGDVASVALPVLRHRVLTTFNAEAAGVKSDDIIKRLVEELGGKDADIKI